MLHVLSTIAGIALLVLLVREVFHQLLHPERRGAFGVVIMRWVRAVARRIGHRAMVLAGPASIGLVFTMWFVLAVVSFALILYPHVPHEFEYGSTAPGRPIIDAFYISMVTISTLGFGDVVPATPLLRLLVPLQSVIGFGLLTASLTWMLSLYAPLARHRTLARYGHELVAAERLEGRQLQELTSLLVAGTVDLKMTHAIYYFHAVDERECFARVALPLWDVANARVAQSDPPEDVRTLLRALDEFAEALAADFLPAVRGADTRTILEAYARDDRRDTAEPSEGLTRS